MVTDFVQALKYQPWYKGQIEHIEHIPPRMAKYGELDKPLPKAVQNYLDRRNIHLYTHQATAINKIRAGNDVIMTTSTASGKTLGFNVPVFEMLITEEEGTALYLYPTKALTNDQLQVLLEMDKEIKANAYSNVYDGDTPQHMRQMIREESRIILSNPYGIHQYLPWHQRWKRFFQNLKFLIIDEAHMYRGVFGTNVALLLRRLLRVCNCYGSEPQIVLSSATIANPDEHSWKLTGRKFEVVSNDGAGRGERFFVFWNPPFIDLARMARRSPHQETKDLFVLQLQHGFQTLCFTVSRQMAELITRWCREDLKQIDSELPAMIAPYRAGYLPEERRDIERKLRFKELLGVASTNALELGIDIGSLDSVIISGYPGTVISTWQQAGRAGRGDEPSLVTLVAFEDQLDQYFMKHPKKFFERSHEYAIVDLENPYAVTGHVMCASAELPMTNGDEKYFGNLLGQSITALEKQKLVRSTPHGWVYSGRVRPVEVVTLDNISDQIVTVVSKGEILETMDLSKAYDEAHTGAILLHQGETYVVEKLDLDGLIAHVVKKNVNYHTEALKTTDIEIVKPFKLTKKEPTIGVGEVKVTEYYHSYVMKTYDRVVGRQPLDLPPLNFETVAMWLTIPQQIKENVESQGLDFQGGIHGVEHAIIGMTPLYAICDRWDVGGVSTPMHHDTNRPTIFVYDSYEGGIGVSEKLYELIREVLQATFVLIRDCECTEGCPSCIYSPKCGNENRPLDKRAAIFILQEVLKWLEKKSKIKT